MRPINADALEARMYHDAFETDSDMQKWDSGCWIRYKMFERALEDATTIELSHWIPCSERLPEEKDAGILKKLGIKKRSECVLVTVEVKGERMVAQACTKDGMWDWDMKYAFPDYKVIAWMSMPEPYRADIRDEKGEKNEN